jgi:Uma2 family endonuclease
VESIIRYISHLACPTCNATYPPDRLMNLCERDGRPVQVVLELSSGRQSFSPDVSYYVGPFPPDVMRFVEGPPTFAVEVRSENHYGPAAEAELAARCADYFEAGTPVVWDVDTIAERVRVYRADAPDQPENFPRGQDVDTEPAVPGWRVAVDWIFD